MSKQLANHILMVRPANFGFNKETAKNNAFQNKGKQYSATDIQKKALREFKGVVKRLKEEKINIIIAKDSKRPKKPDAIFPNNWISTHHNGTLVTYPMYSPKRRKERSGAILKKLEKLFIVKRHIQFEGYEIADMFLEGTGSMIFDRENKIAYACKSVRTHPVLFKHFCKTMGYKACLFRANDKSKNPIYHTNVMMSVGADFAVVCMDSISSKKERSRLKKQFKKTGKQAVEISYKQMVNFAGNMLQVENSKGQSILLMSTAAYRSLKKKQIKVLKNKTKIVHCSIPIIEYFGGGSLRCMIAEVFLPKK